MTLTFSGAVVDCADPAVVADFWQAALGWTGRETGPHGEAVLFPRDGETILGRRASSSSASPRARR